MQHLLREQRERRSWFIIHHLLILSSGVSDIIDSGVTMLVQVEYNALLRKGTGVPRVQVQLPDGATLNHLIEHLCQQHGTAVASLLRDSAGCRSGDVLLFLNDQQVTPAADPVLPLGSTVAILTPISGG